MRSLGGNQRDFGNVSASPPAAISLGYALGSGLPFSTGLHFFMNDYVRRESNGPKAAPGAKPKDDGQAHGEAEPSPRSQLWRRSRTERFVKKNKKLVTCCAESRKLGLAFPALKRRVKFIPTLGVKKAVQSFF
jgi:hypothetical protein